MKMLFVLQLIFSSGLALSQELIEYLRKEVIPSEIPTQEKLNLNALSLVLIPAAKIDEIKRMISDFNPDWPIFPLELIELYEIQFFSNNKKDR